MEDESRRRVLKYFKCNKCRKYIKQLVHPHAFLINCENCGKHLTDVSEKEFKSNQKKPSININFSNSGPIRPNININNFNNPSDVYRRPPSNLNNRREPQQRIPRQSNPSNRRYQSSSHYSNDYSDSNSGTRYSRRNTNENSNTNNNNINSNFANFAYNNIFSSNNNANNIRRNVFEERNDSQNNTRYRERGRSMNPNTMNTNPLNAFINGFFADIPFFNGGGIRMSQPFTINISMPGHNIDDDIFDPIFISFGSSFDNIFRNNFFSNFRSNMSDNIYAQFINSIRQHAEEAERQRHHPTQKAALSKLKRFKLNEKYCKNNNKGAIEYPNCCICITDINKGEDTVMLPCGHMFHWKCCYSWLKDNNTCPVCRFELPKER